MVHSMRNKRQKTRTFSLDTILRDIARGGTKCIVSTSLLLCTYGFAVKARDALDRKFARFNGTEERGRRFPEEKVARHFPCTLRRKIKFKYERTCATTRHSCPEFAKRRRSRTRRCKIHRDRSNRGNMLLDLTIGTNIVSPEARNAKHRFLAYSIYVEVASK